MTTEERFWNKVIKTDTCWLWTACKDEFGYGRVTQNYEEKRAHRVSWAWVNGDIPPNLCVLHKCDVPSCVNPTHLFLGTRKDNMVDRANKKRGNPPIGERSSTAKLTEQQVLEIRDKYTPYPGEYNQSSLAREFGVDRSTIHKIVHNINWNHI